MVMATCKREHLVGGLFTLSEGYFLLIMAGCMAAGMLVGAGAVAENSHLIHRQGGMGGSRFGLVELLKSQNPPPVAHPSPNKAASPNPSLRVPPTGDQAFRHELSEAILIQITTGPY